MISDFDKLGTSLDKAATQVVTSMSDQLKDALAEQLKSGIEDSLRQQGLTEGQISAVDIDKLLLESGGLPNGATLPEPFSNLDLSKGVSIDQLVDQIDVNQLLEQAKEQCKSNPKMQGCEMLASLEASNTAAFKGFEEKAKLVDTYVVKVVWVGIVIALLGILMFFLVNRFVLYYTLYRIGLSSAVSGSALLLAFYLLPGTVSKVLNNKDILNMVTQQYGASIDSATLDSILKIAYDIIMGWMSEPIHKIIWISAIIAIVGLAMTITFFILNKKYPPKGLNKDNKGTTK